MKVVKRSKKNRLLAAGIEFALREWVIVRPGPLLWPLDLGIEPDREVGRFHNCKP